MKKIFIFAFASFVLTTAFIACSSNEEVSETVEATKVTSMKNFNQKVKDNKILLDDLVIASQMNSRSETADAFAPIKETFSLDAKDFSKQLDITSADLEELFGENLTEEQIEQGQIGLMLFAVMLDECNPNGAMASRGGSFQECLGQAMGFAEAAAVIGGLTKMTMSKQTLKLAVKLAAKVGGRTIGGIGLALIAGEIAYCMW